ncbi:hypothetical protein ASPZODRAFT_91125 [Penicilliopsis zonata CBS 506.65]|uniref:Spindle pole body component n=1 Tax=Penicilliopsis zonata CBS 506.65 TaxID=1073090 RepID=A0A1L9SP62_9EURO|nr:hypothetical protein ASPZODRAFT_91125 [Penicilliopsis zonata CBS 506.65]OJJ48988.1 hypothetical protein ASPZODRAFT_91125 [Penicilliopsis zonata CBS 506.65]
MALAASTSTLTDQLIAAVTKNPDQSALRFRSLKRRVEEALRAKTHGRTDQFAVARQLEGLREKFQILDRDDLADALGQRLDALEEHRRSWTPEILSLLLLLSDRPAQLSKNIGVESGLKSARSKPALTWSDLDAEGTAYCDDEIWENVDFAADSSDDDFSTVSSDVSIPKILPERFTVPEEDYVIPEEVFAGGEDEDLLASIKDAQFWAVENRSAVSHQADDYSRRITELQMIREIVFMLQGLPTSIFWRLDEGVEVDRRYALMNASKSATSSLLKSFGWIGARVDRLRRFIKVPQSVPCIQTFHRGVEDCLGGFDSFLSSIHERYLRQTMVTPVSLLQLLEDVRNESRLLLLLAELVSELEEKAYAEPVKCLDKLYDLVCIKQATCDDDEFRFLGKLFFACFETYIRPIRLWMETGQLDSVEGTFFIQEGDKNDDLHTLWHDWYTMDESSRLLNIPRFIQPVAPKIFTAGKSLVFLRHLNIHPENLGQLGKASLTFQDVYPEDASSLAAFCLPFSELLESAFEKLVDANSSITTRILREELEKCDLWISLQALELIYLGKDMSVSSTIDHKIFDLIDRGRGAWNDRFLLTELAQTAFSVIPFIDTSQLIARSSKGSHRDLDKSYRSVEILQALSFDYVLPWPVANIVTKDATAVYQRVGTFLMQIRRAKYTITKQRLRGDHNTTGTEPQSGVEDRDDALGYALRHNLLWFINVLYSYMADLVISSTMDAMLKALAAATDVDTMIAEYGVYMHSLEDQCLLSKDLTPIYRAIINLLDLCIYFADVQATQHGENQYDQSTPATRHRHRRSLGRSTNNTYAGGDENGAGEDDTDSSESGSDLDEGNTTMVSFIESPYLHRLKDLKRQFDQLLAFIVAGLKGVGRVEGQYSWEMLAERLEWRKESRMR